MAPIPGPWHNRPWSKLAPYLVEHGYETLLDTPHPDPAGEERLLIAFHPDKLLLVVTSHAPDGEQLVNLCALFGTVRKLPTARLDSFYSALDHASVTGPVQQLATTTVAFQCYDGRELVAIIASLKKVGELVSWGMQASHHPLTLLDMAKSLVGRELFESLLPTWPPEVQAFLTKAP